MSGLDESGTPLQERIELENIYERFRKEEGKRIYLQDRLDEDLRVARERQIHIYASMAEAGRAIMHNIESHEAILIDEDFSLQRRQRESNRGRLNRILNRMRGRRSEGFSRRDNRSTRESSSPTIDFVA